MKATHSKTGRLPIPCKLLLGLVAVAAPFYVAFLLFPSFADLFNATVGHFLRATLGLLTYVLPFSLAELLLLLLLPAVILFLVRILRRKQLTRRDVWSLSGIALLPLGLVLFLFVMTLAPGYHGTPLEQKMGLERTDVTAEALEKTAEQLLSSLAELEDEIDYLPSGASLMPYSYGEMSALLTDAYDRAAEKYDFIYHFPSRIKPVMLSLPMSYTHITGVYTFFTGEANVNTHFPDYTLPFTAAHELAHQRGIAREDEASFVAFLVCIESGDPYIRYSGYLNLYEYVTSALYRADPERYVALYRALPDSLVGEQEAYRLFFEPFRDSTAASVSNATNDAYLKLQGTQGTASYGLVAELAVAYYRARK